MSAPNSWTPGNMYHGDLYQTAAQHLNKPAAPATAAAGASGFSWNTPTPALAPALAPAPALPHAPIQGGWSCNFSGPPGNPWSWTGQGPAPALAPTPVYAEPFNFGHGSLNSLELKPTISY